MKRLVLLILIVISGCSKTAKPPKTCYELTLSFTGVNSKQIVCTNNPLKESYHFRKL